MKHFEIGLNTGIDHWYAGQVKCVGAFVKANLAVTATQRGYEPKVSKSNDAISWKANEIYQGEWCLLYEAYDFEAYGGGISFRCRAVWQTISEPQLSTKPKIRAKRQANHLGPENKIPKLGNHHHYLVPKTQNTDTHVHQGETRIFFWGRRTKSKSIPASRFSWWATFEGIAREFRQRFALFRFGGVRIYLNLFK